MIKVMLMGFTEKEDEKMEFNEVLLDIVEYSFKKMSAFWMLNKNNLEHADLESFYSLLCANMIANFGVILFPGNINANSIQLFESFNSKIHYLSNYTWQLIHVNSENISGCH